MRNNRSEFQKSSRNHSDELIELRPETLNNFRNLIGNPVKDKDNTACSDRFATFPERYKRKDIRAHMHVHGGFADFCAIFQYYGMRPCEGVVPMIPPMGNGGAHSNFNSNDLNKPMLIGVIDLLEQVEGMLVSVPTSRMVWLQKHD